MSSNLIDSKHKPKVALLLTGGGARAAYQVGVLKAIAEQLPRNQRSPFAIINGTSAGAINATAMSCYAGCYQLGVKKLEYVWKHFRTSQVYNTSFSNVFGYIATNMLRSFKSEYENHQPASLFDNQPLRNLLRNVLELKRIDRNIQLGYLDAISVTASSYSSGDSVAFYQSHNIPKWQRARRRGEPCTINIEHLMASSAIPMVFPSVKIKQGYFGDGSIHQHAPLSPAIHLGADKVFIVGVDQPADNKYFGFQPHYPGISTIAGHLLDTIFSDTLMADIERLSRINRTLNLLIENGIEHELKPIDYYVINPSHNFNEIASHYYDEMPFSVKLLLRSIGVKKMSESSLTSYLLFEKAYTRHLIELGRQDGLAQIDGIMNFLGL